MKDRRGKLNMDLEGLTYEGAEGAAAQRDDNQTTLTEAAKRNKSPPKVTKAEGKRQQV